MTIINGVDIPDSCTGCKLSIFDAEEMKHVCIPMDCMNVPDQGKHKMCPLKTLKTDVIEEDGSGRCQSCHRPLPISITAGYINGVYKYCPSCGKKMEGGKYENT